MKRIICWITSHKWGVEKRFYSENGLSGIPQYRIICERCNKGNKEEWKENKVIIIKSPQPKITAEGK